jgi:hypothetical protein
MGEAAFVKVTNRMASHTTQQYSLIQNYLDGFVLYQ